MTRSPRPSWRTTTLCAAAVLLFTGVAAAAQSSAWHVQVVQQLDAIRAEIGGEFDTASEVMAGELEEGAVGEFTIEVEPDAEYLVTGVCDVDCTDLDLSVFDEMGTELAADVEPDEYPTLSFVATTAGTWTVRVLMASCAARTCVYGAQGYMRLDGFAQPAAPAMTGAGTSPGRFVLQAVPASHPDLDAWRIALQERGRIPALLDALNASLALPRDVRISFQEGDGPLYSPSDAAVVFSYDFLQMTADLVRADDPDASAADVLDTVMATAEFVLFHEVGHALVHQLELPVVGREEDAVDSLATVLAVELVEDPESALAAARVFDLMAGSRDAFDESEFWGEHSLDEQRFFAITCWVFGSDPGAFGDLVEARWLPPEKAQACPANYGQQSSGWLTLLRPAMR